MENKEEIVRSEHRALVFKMNRKEAAAVARYIKAHSGSPETIFAVDVDIMAAFDQVDVLNKAAQIYISAKNMGFEPDGMSAAQMQEITDVFGLPK